RSVILSLFMLVQLSISRIRFLLRTSHKLFPHSLHDALPISLLGVTRKEPLSADMKIKTYKWTSDIDQTSVGEGETIPLSKVTRTDRKSTRLNSSHVTTSYAVSSLIIKHEPEMIAAASFSSFK